MIVGIVRVRHGVVNDPNGSIGCIKVENNDLKQQVKPVLKEFLFQK
ncbi:MAG: hypothetical protein IPO92_00905 [Saprospiraceae bacterium]|nr:hypothetical protein [Saprospiraceae bacterium]